MDGTPDAPLDAKPILFEHPAEGSAFFARLRGEVLWWGRKSSQGRFSVAAKAWEDLAPPGPLDATRKFKTIAAGNDTSMGISDGKLFAWGNNYRGKLGVGVEGPVLVPMLVSPGDRYRAVSLGAFHAIALTEDGKLFSWGEDAYDAVLGLGANEEASPSKLPILDLSAVATEITATTRSPRASITFLSSPRSPVLSRTSSFKQLNFTPNDGSSADQPPLATAQLHRIVIRPHPVVPAGGSFATRFRSVSCGQYHTLALADNGKIYSWGCGQGGRLGHGNENNVSVPTPIPVENVIFKEIAAGGSHSLALDDHGRVWAWGVGYDGRLGLGDRTGALSPKLLTVFRTQKGVKRGREVGQFVGISAGFSHSILLHSDGQIFSFGRNTEGQLGLGDSMPRRVPSPVNFVATSAPRSSRSRSDSTAISENMDSFEHSEDASGSDDGESSEESSSTSSRNATALQDVAPASTIKFTFIAAGRYHSSAITSTGVLFTWGAAGTNFNRLGFRPLSSSRFHATMHMKCPMASIPTRVPLPATITSCKHVALGWDHTVVLAGAAPTVALPSVSSISIGTSSSSLSGTAGTAGNAAGVQQFKVSLYGGQTFKLFYDPQLTVQQVLQKVGAKLPDFDINKYVPKDLAGTELRLDEKLSEVKGHELTFKSLKIDSTPATPASGTTTTTGGKAIASVPPTNIPKKFTVFLSNDQRNTIIYKPELVLRDVLVKMCSNRGLQLNHWVPRDISGRLLDLNMTLGDIGSLEITFNTHPENRDVKVILPDSVTHTLRFNPDTTGAEVLMRACEHRGVPVWKFIAQTVEKQPIDLALPMSKLDIPNRQIIFQVPRAGKYWKDLAAGQAFLRKIVPEIREIVPKSGFGRGISNDLATQLRTLLHRAAAQLTTQFPGYEIITTNQSTVLADTLQHSDRPAWILSICGTENLLSGLPMAGTSLCLVESGRARAAVIHSLQDDTQYFAHEGEGAYANDSQVLFGSRCEDLGSAVISSHVDQVQSSSGALLSTHPTSASAPPRNPDEVPQLVTSKLATRLRRVIFRAAAARSFGAPDIECCLVARGVLDSVCILGANPNMLAAATLILHEARVSILDLDSAAVVDDCATINFWLSARHVICGGARLVDRISKILLPSATLASQNRTKKSGRGRAPSLSLLREDDDSGDSDAMSAVSGVTSHSDDEDEYLQSTSDVADSPHSQSFHEDRSEDQPGSFV